MFHSLLQIPNASKNIVMQQQLFVLGVILTTTTTTTTTTGGATHDSNQNLNDKSMKITHDILNVIQRITMAYDQSDPSQKAQNDCYKSLCSCKMYPETSSWPDSVRLFFWQCVCIIHGVTIKQTTMLSSDVADTALEDIIQIVFKNCETVPKDSVGMEYLIETLEICLESATPERCYCTMEIIATKLLYAKQQEDHYSGRNNIFHSKWMCLKMMEACLRNREDGPQIVLRLKEYFSLLHNVLVPIATNERRYPVLTNLSTTCINIILLYSMSTKMHYRDSSSFPVLPQKDEVRVLTKLLLSHSITTTEQTIEILYTILQKSSKQDNTAVFNNDSTTELHGLIEALVQAESCHQLSIETCNKVVDSFMMLIRHVTDYHFLVRGGGHRLLMLLVRIVGGTSFGGQREQDTQSNHRAIAACILMQLAKNPCNRRILAKTPGLLSSVIRHVRNYQHQHHHSNVDTNTTIACRFTREEMKQQIFQLAESL
jgi:hypothetical protein